jgi:site-specific DNA-cytosine methylase
MQEACPHEHICRDVMAHVQLPVWNADWSFRDKCFAVLTSPVSPVLWCDFHEQQCRLPDVDLDVSGFPCVDWAPSGNRLGVEGPTIGVLLCICHWHLERETPLVLLENVPDFRTELVFALMQHKYYIVVIYLSPKNVGAEFLSRERVFIWMVHMSSLLLFELVEIIC